MPELPDLTEMRAAWVNQPTEESPVDLDRVYRRRTGDLFAATRSEVMNSIGAALFFALVVTWRFSLDRNRLAPVGAVVVVVWVAITLFRFRSSLRRNTLEADALAATGLEHYRRQLARRRDHLRSFWIWHGPLWLAGVVAVVTLSGRVVPGRLWEAMPVMVLLVLWAAFGVRRRFREAAVLQQEIDELADGE